MEISKCYICELTLVDNGSDWDMHNIDGGQHPLCWGCSEKMNEHAQDNMYQDREQTHPEEF